ncbi:hypothetical protein RBE51_13400 [Pseudomonas taiwanensis]|uniref:hypothetical protein n=1 Tax=Pseudomonas taiwanensis TaxID=470150 RepID=UPI0028DEC390|nr:hypothetical protein [Pseudomonas taiwanensis]MDT8923810.1 hypothetical protein [Pseudomonas taiwanensis]
MKKVNLEMYQECLREAGCEIDTEFDFQGDKNHVWFSHDGLNYLLSVDGSDDGFVEITIPYELDGDPESSRRCEVFNHVARTYKIIKCFYTADAFIVSGEAFVKSSNDFKKFLKYCLSSLRVAYEDVAEKYPDGV